MHGCYWIPGIFRGIIGEIRGWEMGNEVLVVMEMGNRLLVDGVIGMGNVR